MAKVSPLNVTEIDRQRGEMMTDLTFQVSDQATLEARVKGWLSAFEEVLGAQDYPRLSELFVDDSHWRDMGAFTWDLGNVSGLDTIEKLMRASVVDVKPSGFVLRQAPDCARPELLGPAEKS